MAQRFILNYDTRRIHDRKRLGERCNTDQVQARGEATKLAVQRLLLQGWTGCSWCFPSKEFGGW